MNISIAGNATSSSTSSSSSSSSFSFLPLPGRQLSAIDQRESRELLMKWGMLGRLRSQTFTFDEPFRAFEARNFVSAFFNSPEVAAALEVNAKMGGASVIFGSRQGVELAEFEEVPVSHLSMALFDRLEGPIVREGTGLIRKCFDDWQDDILVSDELRQMLVMEDSESFLLYEEEERSEFLFRIFAHLAIGGQVCQFEDELEPYLDLTRSIYKELLAVQKESATSAGDNAAPQLKIISHVYRVAVKDSVGWCYPENDHRNSFAYLVVDPLKRLVTTFYHSFGISATAV